MVAGGMITDEEILQSAWTTKMNYGAGAMAHALSRITALLESEDEPDVRIWERIVAALRDMEDQPGSGHR